MSLWFGWFLVWILFLIAEIFFLSGDFFALGIAALLTAFIFKFFANLFEGYNLFWASSVIFLISSVISRLLTKYFVKKINKGKDVKVFAHEKIVWQHLIVQDINGQKVVYFEWIYWPIANDEEIQVWSKVEVVKFENNKVWVKKLI